ncbi:MAG: ParA family protein [Planctomycetes bacterium]|nr:ParA family protein [Planctomycetota bacterium]
MSPGAGPCVIAVAARKGGVGKTTVACGLASVLAAAGRRVLVVDLDPQSNAAYVLGVDPTLAGTAAWLTGATPEFQVAADNLMVLAGGPELVDRTVQRLDPHDLHAVATETAADVIVCDCPPGDEHLERLAIRAAQVALIVTDAHPLAVKGAGRVIEDLEADRRKGHRTPARTALVLSKVDTRRSMDRGLDAHLQETWGTLPRLTVRQDVDVAQATAAGVPIMRSAPNSRGAQDLQAIVRWINGEA